MRNSLMNMLIILFLCGQLITKDVFVHSSNTTGSFESSSITKSPTSTSTSIIESSLSTFHEKVDFVRRAIEKLTCLSEHDGAPQDDTSTFDNSVNSILVILNDVVKFEKTLNDLKQFSLLTASEGFALYLLKNALHKFIKKFNQKESSLRINIPAKLLNELENELTCIIKETLEEQLLNDCVNKIKFHSSHEAWKALLQITGKEKINFIIKTVYSKNESNFDMVLDFAKAGPNAHESLAVYNSLYNEMMYAGHSNTLRLLSLIDHLENKILEKSQNFTASEIQEFVELTCILHDSLSEHMDTKSRSDLEYCLLVAEGIHRILINERKMSGIIKWRSTSRSKLEDIRDRMPIVIKAMIFEWPVFLRTPYSLHYLCVSNDTDMNEITHRQLFSRELKHAVPHDREECKWKLKRFIDGKYAIINLHNGGILFSDTQRYEERWYNKLKRFVSILPKHCFNTKDSFWDLRFHERDLLSIRSTFYNEYLFTEKRSSYEEGQYRVYTMNAYKKWEVFDSS